MWCKKKYTRMNRITLLTSSFCEVNTLHTYIYIELWHIKWQIFTRFTAEGSVYNSKEVTIASVRMNVTTTLLVHLLRSVSIWFSRTISWTDLSEFMGYISIGYEIAWAAHAATNFASEYGHLVTFMFFLLLWPVWFHIYNEISIFSSTTDCHLQREQSRRGFALFLFSILLLLDQIFNFHEFYHHWIKLAPHFNTIFTSWAVKFITSFGLFTPI